MSSIVSDLVTSGMSDGWILKHIGMDKDELLRLKQITGLAALFVNTEFSESKIDNEILEEELEEDEVINEEDENY